MIVKKGLKAAALLSILTTLMGCMAVGPHTAGRDRFDYAAAICDSWKDQMLINMVKLRYGDTPAFLEVASVISQYGVQSEIDFGLLWADPVTTAFTNTRSVGGAVSYVERPTITYSPLTGEKFARKFL